MVPHTQAAPSCPTLYEENKGAVLNLSLSHTMFKSWEALAFEAVTLRDQTA